MTDDVLISALRLLALVLLAITAVWASPVTRRPRIERNLLMIGGVTLLLASAVDLGADLSPALNFLAAGFPSTASLRTPVLAGYLFGFLLLSVGLLRRPLTALKELPVELLSGAGKQDRWTEQVVQESKARYKTLVDKAPDAILVLDVDANRFVEDRKSVV